MKALKAITIGNYHRRITGWIHQRKEGQLSALLQTRIDQRLQLYGLCKPFEFDRKIRPISTCVNKYKHHELRELLMYYQYPVFYDIVKKEDLINVMRLQHAWLLIGGSSTKPIPSEDTKEAREAIGTYIKELIELKIPIRSMTHASYHIPDDVDNMQCAAERNATWMFESVQSIHRVALKTGNKPCEQIRNRFIERFKYHHPTTTDGKIMDSHVLFEIEVAKAAQIQNKQQVVVEFKVGKKKENPTTTVTLPTFKISNKLFKKIVS